MQQLYIKSATAWLGLGSSDSQGCSIVMSHCFSMYLQVLLAVAGILLLDQPLLLRLAAEGREVGKCFQDIEGSRCHERSKAWQHDGVCLFKGSAGGQPGPVCAVPDKRKFKFAIIAKLRQLKKIAGAKHTAKLWIRGSGPGLSWEKSTEMKKTASALDVWRTELSFDADSGALPCLSSSYCAMNQAALEFRLYRDQLAQDGMFGPNFRVSLPISHSLSGAVDFMIPEVTVHPWFDGKMITKTDFTIRSSTYVTGQESELEVGVTLLYPPSFDYNIHKRYPLIIMFGTKEPILITPLLEHMFLHEASIDEAVVASIHYLDAAPFCLLSPFKGSKIWRCKTGKACHKCQSCWDYQRAEPCDEEDFIAKAKKCLIDEGCQGRGEEILDFIEIDILPSLLERTANRLLLDPPRSRVSIIGYDGAGLLACFAALTRPTVYGNAGCLSAPFAWPLKELLPDVTEVFGMQSVYERKLLRQPKLQMEYATQKYFIDTGEKDNFFFPVVNPFHYTEQFINSLKENLKLRDNVNILYMSFPRMDNSYYHFPDGGDKMLQRIRYPLLFFLGAKGGPSKNFSRMLQITEQSYAERNAKLGATGGDKDVIAPDTSGTGHETTFLSNNSKFCTTNTEQVKSKNHVPLPVFLATLGKVLNGHCTCMH